MLVTALRRAFIGALAYCALSSFASGATTSGAAAPAPVIDKLLSYEIHVDRSGLATTTMHIRLQATNAASAQQIGQQPIEYPESMQEIDVVDATTIKTNGQRLTVDPSAIFIQRAQSAPNIPMFDDLRQKTIVFPDVEAGDTIDFTVRLVDKSTTFPNAFTFWLAFPPPVPYEKVEVSVSAPRELPLVAETHDMGYERRENGPDVVHRWSYSAPAEAAVGTSIVSSFPRSPRLLVSSFASYDAFAARYAAVLAAHIAVTPKIQAKADEITAGIDGHAAQAKKIYEWVSEHVRYVAIEFGTGTVVPHDAETVLANGYGDCKDHVALFSALLKAKGIGSDFVLINYGNAYKFPSTAVIGELNHAIAWIPELGFYADTTAGVAPFGTLPFPEYGKPVVHVVDQGGAVRATPVLPADVATVHSKTVAKVTEDGKVEGETTITAGGPFATLLRQAALGIQARGPEQATADAFRNASVPGTGTFDVPSPHEWSSEYSLKSEFSEGPFDHILDGRRFEIPTGVAVLGAPGNFLMGPTFNANLSDKEPTPCYSGHEIQEISLEAPPGRVFSTPPADADVKAANLSFSTHWTVAGKSLTLRREFTSHMDHALCEGAERVETARALARIRESFNYGAAIAPKMTPQQQELIVTIKAAEEATRRHDYSAAIESYSTALGSSALPPVAIPSLYLARAGSYVAAEQLDPAIADYEKAVSLNPGLAPRYLGLANQLEDRREFDRAERALTTAIGFTPGMARLFDERGIVRDYQARNAEALDDFTAAIKLAKAGDDLSKYYFDRAESFLEADQFDLALKNYDESIARNGKAATSYQARGIAEIFLQKFDDAKIDVEKSAALDPNDDYALLWLYVAEARKREDAEAGITRRASGRNLAGWPGPLVRVLRGDMGPDQVTLPAHDKAWQTARDRCEKHFYVGEYYLAKGDVERAKSEFQDALATNVKEYKEYSAARFELERLAR